jgi:hypothetical protein
VVAWGRNEGSGLRDMVGVANEAMGLLVPYKPGVNVEGVCRLVEAASEDDCWRGTEHRGSMGRDSSDVDCCWSVAEAEVEPQLTFKLLGLYVSDGPSSCDSTSYPIRCLPAAAREETSSISIPGGGEPFQPSSLPDCDF